MGLLSRADGVSGTDARDEEDAASRLLVGCHGPFRRRPWRARRTERAAAAGRGAAAATAAAGGDSVSCCVPGVSRPCGQNRPVARRAHSRSHGDAVARRRQDTAAVRRRWRWVPKRPPLPAGSVPCPLCPGHSRSLPRNLLLPVSRKDRPCQLPGTPLPALHTGAPVLSRHELPREASDLAPRSGAKSGHSQPSPVTETMEMEPSMSLSCAAGGGPWELSPSERVHFLPPTTAANAHTAPGNT